MEKLIISSLVATSLSLSVAVSVSAFDGGKSELKSVREQEKLYDDVALLARKVIDGKLAVMAAKDRFFSKDEWKSIKNADDPQAKIYYLINQRPLSKDEKKGLRDKFTFMPFNDENLCQEIVSKSKSINLFKSIKITRSLPCAEAVQTILENKSSFGEKLDRFRKKEMLSAQCASGARIGVGQSETMAKLIFAYKNLMGKESFFSMKEDGEVQRLRAKNTELGHRLNDRFLYRQQKSGLMRFAPVQKFYTWLKITPLEKRRGELAEQEESLKGKILANYGFAQNYNYDSLQEMAKILSLSGRSSSVDAKEKFTKRLKALADGGALYQSFLTEAGLKSKVEFEPNEIAPAAPITPIALTVPTPPTVKMPVVEEKVERALPIAWKQDGDAVKMENNAHYFAKIPLRSSDNKNTKTLWAFVTTRGKGYEVIYGNGKIAKISEDWKLTITSPHDGKEYTFNVSYDPSWIPSPASVPIPALTPAPTPAVLSSAVSSPEVAVEVVAAPVAPVRPVVSAQTPALAVKGIDENELKAKILGLTSQVGNNHAEGKTIDVKMAEKKKRDEETAKRARQKAFENGTLSVEDTVAEAMQRRYRAMNPDLED